MADNRTQAQRSYNMSRIRSKNTKPEILVRKFLFSKGYRYRLHNTKLPGKPDLVLKKHKCVIFIHGCFWHGHPNCKFAKKPATNAHFWSDKIAANCNRDLKNLDLLCQLDWNVITIWECDLSKESLANTLKLLLNGINSKRSIPIHIRPQ